MVVIEQTKCTTVIVMREDHQVFTCFALNRVRSLKTVGQIYLCKVTNMSLSVLCYLTSSFKVWQRRKYKCHQTQ